MKTEQALDIALTAATELAALLPAARLNAGVAAEIGHDAIANAMKAASTIVQARTEMLETHRELAKARDQVGLRAFGLGGLMPKAADLSRHTEVANAA